MRAWHSLCSCTVTRWFRMGRRMYVAPQGRWAACVADCTWSIAVERARAMPGLSNSPLMRGGFSRATDLL
jgi:hypothetical protein